MNNLIKQKRDLSIQERSIFLYLKILQRKKMYKSVGYTEKITGVNEFLYTERLVFLYIIVTVSMTYTCYVYRYQWNVPCSNQW